MGSEICIRDRDETYGQGIYERTEPAPLEPTEDAPGTGSILTDAELLARGKTAGRTVADFAEAADDVVAMLAEQLAPVGDHAIAAWSEQLRDALAAAGDLAEFAETLGALAPQLDVEGVAEIMRRATVVAHVRGIEDVRAES